MSDKELYIKKCAAKKGIPIFLQPWWLDAVCPAWGAAVARNGDEIAGIWPYPIEQKMGIALLRTPMLTPYLGPHIFYPPDLRDSRLDSFEHETITELIKQLPECKVWHLAIAPGIKQAGIFKRNRLHNEVQQTFLIDLNESEEALLARIKESARRNIRQAEKEITITNDSSCLPQLYKFQENTLATKNKKLAYTEAGLQQVMNACIANNACALWVAKSAGVIEAIVWQVWDDARSYYLMGGQNPEANGYKAMTLLLWHAMKEAKKKGNSTFDMEGSMDDGVERFFRNFGGRRELYLVLQKNESLLWKLKTKIMG